MYSPQIQSAFSVFGISLAIIPLVPIDWLIVLVLGLVPVALLELTKLIIGKREQVTLLKAEHLSKLNCLKNT